MNDKTPINTVLQSENERPVHEKKIQLAFIGAEQIRNGSEDEQSKKNIYQQNSVTEPISIIQIPFQF